MNPQYITETAKTRAQAVTDLEAAVQQHGYGVLHIHDLKETLAAKGFDLPNACHILEVCNPNQAAAVLAAEMGMNIALPCRIVRRRARAAPLSRCKCGRICVSHLT